MNPASMQEAKLIQGATRLLGESVYDCYSHKSKAVLLSAAIAQLREVERRHDSKHKEVALKLRIEAEAQKGPKK